MTVVLAGDEEWPVGVVEEMRNGTALHYPPPLASRPGLAYSAFTSESWRVGGEVTQRIANP